MLRLDKIASIIFSTAYLLMFALLSVITVVIFMMVVFNPTGELLGTMREGFLRDSLTFILMPLVFGTIILALLYMLDFLTFGMLFKRFK